MKNSPLKISNVTIQPGERITLALPTPELYTCAPMYIPIHVLHGQKSGPVLMICGALHGDEINGVAIIQRLMQLRLLKSLRGTLIVIPTINVYGMMTQSRNLPDRRDLEGSFPGSDTGSFASRLAHLLTTEIFSLATHCIDLHTGEPHIKKFPQVKTSIGNKAAEDLAQHFQAPVIINTELESGLLWLLNREEGKIPTIIYETGEALRLDEKGIKMGVKGIVRVMKSIGMLTKAPAPPKRHCNEVETEYWVRAPSSGLCEIFQKIGTPVSKGDLLAKIFDPFGTDQREEIHAPMSGIVIATNSLPILNEGEPILQIAKVKKAAAEEIQHWDDEAES